MQTKPPRKADNAPWIPETRPAAIASIVAAKHCHHKTLRMGLLSMRNIIAFRLRKSKPADCNNPPYFRQPDCAPQRRLD
jgi:hypothetical protein